MPKTIENEDAEIKTVDTLPLATLKSNIEAFLGHIAKARLLVPGLIQFDEVERQHSEGRMRDGEPEVLIGLTHLAEAHPHLFKALADKDHGKDPKTFETGLLRERLERRELLAKAATEVESLGEEMTDQLLQWGEVTKPILLSVYHIAKALGEHDTNVATMLAPAKDFYGRPARRGAETRRKKNEEKKKGP